MAAVGFGGRSSSQADAGAATFWNRLLPPHGLLMHCSWTAHGLHAEAVPPPSPTPITLAGANGKLRLTMSFSFITPNSEYMGWFAFLHSIAQGDCSRYAASSDKIHRQLLPVNHTVAHNFQYAPTDLV